MTFHHSRYGEVNRLNPEAAGRCDRGGEIRKRSDLQREMRWAGTGLVWSGFWCCREHIDPPHPQDRVPPYVADPPPVPWPKPNIDGGAAGPLPPPVVIGNALLTEDLYVLETEGGDPLLEEEDAA